MSKLQPGPWYGPLADLQSKGSTVNPIGGLAGLAAARAEHQGQFFTPLPLVAVMWKLAGLLGPCRGMVSIFDNSSGSGRMFAFADPDRHKLFGIELDRELAEKVQAAVKAADFTRHLEIGSLDEFRLASGSFNVGLLNPPFSITIDTPYVEAAPCNAYGKYGPKSSALSHAFAVWQALQWCRHVVAVVPRSFGDAVLGDDQAWAWARSRLNAVCTIPRSVFVDEGANVDVVVVVFGPEQDDEDERKPVLVKTLRSLSLSSVPALFDLSDEPWWSEPKLTHIRDDSREPAITLPYTGDTTVRVVHDGRKIGLRFACGNTQGRVLNAIYRDRAFGSRYMPRGIRAAEEVEWAGQGWFDMQNYLAQPDPTAALAEFAVLIQRAGGKPEVDPAIPRILARKARRQEIEREPFRHVAFINDGGLSRWLDANDQVTGTCTEPLTFGYWPQRCTEIGEAVTFTRSGNFGRSDRDRRTGPRWSATIQQWFGDFTQDQLLEHFDFDVPAAHGWQVVHEGLEAAFPREFELVRKRAQALGLDQWCSWGYQFFDLCEIALKRRAVIGWDMGLGKARLALALCMLGGERNLITVEASLLDEMRREIDKLAVPRDTWQFITKPEHARSLKRINVVTYSRLKSVIDKGTSKTYADVLRRRIHTHICDEGHVVRNAKTEQTRAVVKVSAKDRYLMTGTPIANYPRDVLPLVQWVAGDGTATQAFGNRWPYMREKNLREIESAPRGTDVFRDMFVVTKWITNEFADDLRSGAKREIPEIADVAGFRAFVAPWIKRRVMEEPEVAAYIKAPERTYTTTVVEWDRRHLAFYVKVAREFVDWFKNLPEWKQKGGANMVAILAKMQAVERAANFPAFGVPGQAKFPHVTSKQRLALARLREWTKQGHKSILFCQSPDTVDWFHSALAKHGVHGVKFHGEIPIDKRVKALDREFRFGDAPVLLATKGCLQTGYNIPQACRVFAYDRTWTPKTEHQAFARVLRPQQTAHVLIEFAHLPGSIDEYQAQMVEAKAAAMRAGLDYGSEEKTGEDFAHIETILGRFIEDFEAQFGITADDLIAEIAEAP